MPDLERSVSASFISSKDGAIPVAASRWLMNVNSSCCFLVSMAISRHGTNPKQLRCSSLVRGRRQAQPHISHAGPGRPWRLFARLFAIADRPITAARNLGSGSGLLDQAIVDELQSPQILPRRAMILAPA